MGDTVRFGVSIDRDLLAAFDAYCGTGGYDTRSEAIRDLIREALVARKGIGEADAVAGTLTLVYDHHKSDLAQKLTSAQHEAHVLIVATLHVHLDHDNCLEVLVLRGNGRAVSDFANQILAVKGVKHGKFVLTAGGGGIV